MTDAQTMIARLPRRLSVQSMLLTGIRGVGKTVLLNEVSRIAEAGKVVYPIYLEATEDRTLAEMLASPLRMTLLKLDRIAKTKDVVRKGMIGLRNFLGTVKVHYGDFGIDSGVGLLALELCPGRADYACGREVRGRRRRRQA